MQPMLLLIRYAGVFPKGVVSSCPSTVHHGDMFSASELPGGTTINADTICHIRVA